MKTIRPIRKANGSGGPRQRKKKNSADCAVFLFCRARAVSGPVPGGIRNEERREPQSSSSSESLSALSPRTRVFLMMVLVSPLSSFTVDWL